MLAALLVAAGVATATAAATPGTGASSSPVQRLATVQASLSASVAGLRAKAGLARLRQDPALARAAGAHTVEMVEYGFFSHASLDGTPARVRIARYYPRRESGRPWRVGEVIVWNQGSASTERVMARVLASPLHRAQLLDPRFRSIGVGAVFSRAAQDAFGGRPALVVTLVLGTR